jgi:hypothetical protein
MTELATQLQALLNAAPAEADSMPVVNAGELVLDYVASFGCVSAHATPDGFTLDTPSCSESVRLAVPYTFRVLLARLGVQASSLSGRQLNLYGDTSDFSWHGQDLHQQVRNSGTFSFRIDKKNANKTPEHISEGRGRPSENAQR